MHMRQHVAWVHLGQLMSNIYWTLTSVPINCVSAQQQRCHSMVLSSKCGQCHVDSRCGRQNTHVLVCLFLPAVELYVLLIFIAVRNDVGQFAVCICSPSAISHPLHLNVNCE